MRKIYLRQPVCNYLDVKLNDSCIQDINKKLFNDWCETNERDYLEQMMQLAIEDWIDLVKERYAL